MDLKSMIVLLDSGRHARARIDFAVDLALRHGAHLSAVHVAYSTLYPFPAEAGMERLIAELDEYRENARKNVGAQFTEAAQRAGIAYDWAWVEGVDTREACVRARMHDLVIAGQLDPEDPELSFAGGFAESIVLGAGRPVLMLPYAGALPARFGTVLIAWNGSREAARAVADALPLLREARLVAIATVESEKEQPAAGTLLPKLDIAEWLSRHGVKPEMAPPARVDIDVGEWLLSRAADMGADLIVAGAYGHARLREFVLGGVTRTLLQSMPVPVLLSH